MSRRDSVVPIARRELENFSVSRSSFVIVIISSIDGRESSTTSDVISFVIDAIGSATFVLREKSTSCVPSSITSATLDLTPRASSTSPSVSSGARRSPCSDASDGRGGTTA